MRKLLYIFAILFSLSASAQVPVIPYGVGATVGSCTLCSVWNPDRQGDGVLVPSLLDTLTATVSPGVGRSGVSKVGKTSGKWYAEFWFNAGQFGFIGIATNPNDSNTYTGNSTTSWGYYSFTGDKYHDPAGAIGYGNSWAVGDTIGVALDMDNDAVYFSKNGVWQNGGIPWSGSAKIGAAFTSGLSGNIIYMAWGIADSNPDFASVTANFGATSFRYKVPYTYKRGFY